MSAQECEGPVAAVQMAASETTITIEFLRTTDVAKRLNISVRRVQMLMRQRLLPGTRVCRTWLVPRPVLDEYIAQLMRRSRQHTLF